MGGGVENDPVLRLRAIRLDPIGTNMASDVVRGLGFRFFLMVR